jgi:hypothetical protein
MLSLAGGCGVACGRLENPATSELTGALRLGVGTRVVAAGRLVGGGVGEVQPRADSAIAVVLKGGTEWTAVSTSCAAPITVVFSVHAGEGHICVSIMSSSAEASTARGLAVSPRHASRCCVDVTEPPGTTCSPTCEMPLVGWAWLVDAAQPPSSDFSASDAPRSTPPSVPDAPSSACGDSGATSSTATGVVQLHVCSSDACRKLRGHRGAATVRGGRSGLGARSTGNGWGCDAALAMKMGLHQVGAAAALCGAPVVAAGAARTGELSKLTVLLALGTCACGACRNVALQGDSNGGASVFGFHCVMEAEWNEADGDVGVRRVVPAALWDAEGGDIGRKASSSEEDVTVARPLVNVKLAASGAPQPRGGSSAACRATSVPRAHESGGLWKLTVLLALGDEGCGGFHCVRGALKRRDAVSSSLIDREVGAAGGGWWPDRLRLSVGRWRVGAEGGSEP